MLTEDERRELESYTVIEQLMELVCNRFKGSDLASIDLSSRRVVTLFDPRTQRWQRHFRLNGALIEAITASGRVTATLLDFNDDERNAHRLGLIEIGHFPFR